MKCGSLCHVKSKRNSLNSFVVVYPDIDEIIEARTKRNQWFPSIVSQPNISLSLNQSVDFKPVNQHFAVLGERQDCNGNFYYRCLYNDSYGWIIGSRKSFEFKEEK